ncbi:MAG: arginine--tRNA ligase [Candidatus Magnetoovum sp. WYHC-5]|nr:arginine--tRNA ligase [Candidatus Magnetoovum sp. WYHC-5]
MIDELIYSAVAGYGLTSDEIEIEVPKHEGLGDLSTPVAMALAKKLKKAPRQIATELITHFDGVSAFKKVEVAGPGFINFWLNDDFLYSELKRLYDENKGYLRKNQGKGKRVQVEFVSANPTGPLHLGHGRGAALGNALSNLLQAAGYAVEREFYVNDAGKQIFNLGLSVYARYQSILGNDMEFPDDGYRGEYITELAEDIINKEGRTFLNSTFESVKDFFIDYSYKKMLNEIKEDLSAFGVNFDSWQSERELFQLQVVEQTIADLKSRDSLKEDAGALWFKASDFGDEKDRVIIKSDGQYTYFASDISYHHQKLKRGFQELINIWGADHHGYIPRMKAVIKAMGYAPDMLNVLLVQMVSLLRGGKPVSMSKRAGEFVTLKEVVNEIGSDIAKFIFLTRRADSHLSFDLEVVKKSSAENPVFYVQYAYARINSIFNKALQNGWQLQSFGNVNLSLLKLPEELRIIKKLLFYPLLFISAVRLREPHRITFYLQELCGLFHPYYNSVRVLVEEQQLASARLFLCSCIKLVIEECTNILGVSVPEERM